MRNWGLELMLKVDFFRVLRAVVLMTEVNFAGFLLLHYELGKAVELDVKAVDNCFLSFFVSTEVQEKPN